MTNQLIDIPTIQEIEQYNCDCHYKGKWIMLPIQWFNNYVGNDSLKDYELISCPHCGRVRLAKTQ